MRRARAFTLIEVLVALVIVTLGISAVLASLSASAKNTTVLREKSLAQWVALNQIAVTRLSLNVPMIGSSEGDVNFANGKWHWRQDVDNPGIVPGLLRITVRVRRADAQQTASQTPSRAASAESASSSSDNVSYVTSVVGFRGDAIASANGDLPSWIGTDPTGSATTPANGNATTGSTVTMPNTTSGSTTGTTTPTTSGGSGSVTAPSTGGGG